MNQALDLDGHLDIAAAIEPLAGSALVGLELRELGLPKTKDVSFDLADAGYVANFEIETVGDEGQVRGRDESALCGERRGHGENERGINVRERPFSRGSIGQILHWL
jgi:hypothetical protein